MTVFNGIIDIETFLQGDIWWCNLVSIVSKCHIVAYHIVFFLVIFPGVGCVMYEPSFVSEWYEAVSDKQSLAELTIKHDLGMYPVKVDVQVKITEGGQDFIFSGIGSSQRDDDLPYNFSGVVYRYNQSCVQLAYPFNHNYNRATPVSRGLAYIGTYIRTNKNIMTSFKQLILKYLLKFYIINANSSKNIIGLNVIMLKGSFAFHF